MSDEDERVMTTCAELQEIIEPLAAGELEPREEISAHLVGCPRCTARLALARRLDELLATSAVPEPPSNFATAIVRRIRHEWWRSEQAVDLWFNVAVVSGLLLMLAGLWLLMNLSGLTAVTADASSLFVAGLRAIIAHVAPLLPTYVGAVALVLTVFTVWWWADRGLTV